MQSKVKEKKKKKKEKNNHPPPGPVITKQVDPA
jgi:hypothetical protein